MKLTENIVDNVEEIKVITSVSCYGIGLLTMIWTAICNLTGIENKLLESKITTSKNNAINELIDKAKEIDAKGIMKLRIELNNINVFVYGIAYK